MGVDILNPRDAPIFYGGGGAGAGEVVMIKMFSRRAVSFKFQSLFSALKIRRAFLFSFCIVDRYRNGIKHLTYHVLLYFFWFNVRKEWRAIFTE